MSPDLQGLREWPKAGQGDRTTMDDRRINSFGSGSESGAVSSRGTVMARDSPIDLSPAPHAVRITPVCPTVGPEVNTLGGAMAINLDSVKFSLSGWIHDADEQDGLNSIRRWTNETGDTLTLHCFPEPDPSPFELGNEEAYREFSRQIADLNDSGLVEADMIELGTALVYRSIHKYPQDPTGFTFVCGLSLPPHFAINAQAAELGVTGIRETAVAESLGETADPGLIGRILGRGKRWSADPYDRGRDGMCFKSDSREWDSRFPDHPLSRVRNYLEMILSSVTWPS